MAFLPTQSSEASYSFITCGIYGLYWYYKMTNETHQAVGRETTASGGKAVLFAIITCGIYMIYWTYKMGDSIVEAQEQRRMHVDTNTPVIYLVFAIFGLSIVSQALLQNALNDIIDFDSQPHDKPMVPAAPADSDSPVAPAELPPADDAPKDPEMK